MSSTSGPSTYLSPSAKVTGILNLTQFYVVLSIEPQGFVHARQALCQLSYIPSPQIGFLSHICGLSLQL